MSPPPAIAVADHGTSAAYLASLRDVPEQTPSAGIVVSRNGSFWRKLVAFSGPGYLVAVGYMDPGNWATGIAAGSAFGYRLLSVVFIANVMAMFLQALSAKLGIVTGLDLAQACRARYNLPTTLTLWLLCETAIIACDLAEVLGTAIALQLLFGIPLLWGVALTVLDVIIILGLQSRGVRYLEAFVMSMIAVIGTCFFIEMLMAAPSLAGVAHGMLPTREIVTSPTMLYLAMGIVGATVMPHNLYLHSSIVQARRFGAGDADKAAAIRFATWDSSLALVLALVINSAIVILAATAFHATGRVQVTGIEEAFKLLSPVLGVGLASTLFAIGLLASGQNSTITGTLAGQIVMEGFTSIRMRLWLRRSVSRLLAIVPAFVVITLYGPGATAKLLIASQVVLSLQLPFAVVPLVRLTSDRKVMGMFANSSWVGGVAIGLAAFLIALNIKLLGGML
jgi:manganese transport protein